MTGNSDTSADIEQDVEKVAHEEMRPGDWFGVLEPGVAVHFKIACDHQWWLAYDPDGEYEGEFDGPWQLWTTYPTGPWDHSPLTKGIMRHHLGELYWEGHPEDRDSDIRQASVWPLDDAPEFVRRQVGGAKA